MFFSNLNSFSIIIFTILLILWLLLISFLKNKRKKKIVISALFLSIFFILINIFWIKWWFNTKIEEVVWWKLIFVLDVSKSMNTIDWNDNNVDISRLELSKKLIDTYINSNIKNSYGLIIFSWEAVETIPFISDIWEFKTMLYAVNSTNINKEWTNLDSVFESLNSYSNNEKNPILAIILTDWGDENINISEKMIEWINNIWINISFIWIWTSAWSNIPVWKDSAWNIIYKIYNWQNVISKLNSENLKKFSSKYNFEYIEIFSMDKYNDFKNFINENIKSLIMKKYIDYRTDYTRLFIFISFIFFVVFLIFDNLIWIKK